MKPVSAKRESGRRNSPFEGLLHVRTLNGQGTCRSGFSIVEAIAYLVVFSVLMGAITYAMGSLFSQQANPVVTYNSNVYTLAPSFSDFGQAISLHAAFSNSVDAADNIVVAGGKRTHPVYDPTGPSAAISSDFSDTTLTAASLSGADPFSAFSSWGALNLNTAQLSPHLTSNPDSADFTVLTVQGMSRITSVTQQRRYSQTIGTQVLALYEVSYQQVDWTSGSPVLVPNPASGTTPTYVYRFYYPASEDVWSMPPGATHYWYRADVMWDREQEGPTRVVFADPYALAGQDPNSPLSPVSRFVYFLPQLR